MFVQSFKMNTLFILILLSFVIIAYIIGELWIHGKLLFLFPRYHQKLRQAEEKGETYQLNHSEKQVLRKFGRMIILVNTLVVLVLSLMLFVTRKCSSWISISLLIGFGCLLLYHYHRSYRD